jgi:hypothetical protein
MNPLEINTAIPGEIVAFDPATQTASVNIAITAQHHDSQVPITTLRGVPVMFPNVMGFAITFPIKVFPCPCMLVFQQRSIDEWYTNGGVVDPLDNRSHDYSDAIAVPGLRHSKQALAGFNNDAMELRTEDGSTKIVIADGKIAITNGQAELVSIVSELLGALSTEKAKVTYGNSAGQHSLTGNATYTALKSKLDTLIL